MSEYGPGDWWIDLSCRWCRRREVHVAQLEMYHRGCEARAAARAAAAAAPVRDLLELLDRQPVSEVVA